MNHNARVSFQSMQSADAVPGDVFERCSKSCSMDPTEQLRLNAWKLQDSEADMCCSKCSLGDFKLINDKGDVDTNTLAKILEKMEPKVDLTPFKVRNVNVPGFLQSYIDFVNANRAGLAKTLNHPEGV